MQGFLLRLKDDGTRTLGRLLIFDGIKPVCTFVTLELPWKNNQKQKSCIPADNYDVKPYNSPTKGRCFEVQNVAMRDNILIHILNFPSQTQGCIGIGMDFADIDGDKKLDIKSSTIALNELLKKCPDGFYLTIVW